MKNMQKKPRFPKLSVKIILTLFAVIFAVAAVLNLVFAIAQAAGFTLSNNAEDIDAWMQLMFILFGLIFGVSILFFFSIVINRTVVKRICKLEEATKEVAKGNLGIEVTVKGKDELSNLTVSFNKMSAELKANEYLSKEFVRNISHEFKTPISAIRAYGELLDLEADSKKTDRATLKEYASIIMKESDRLSVMSKSILQLSLLDSTTIIKKDDNFKPAEQIREILRLMQAKWSEKNLKLDLQLEEMTITNNEQLLHQVWQNLISNAIKFSKVGGTLKVIVTRNGETGVHFEITDSGTGIKEENKEHIFDHFYMADKSRNTEGSGLGLAICKKILSKLGGEIGFESKDGEGSKFFVRLE